jgi:hypothetical protein
MLAEVLKPTDAIGDWEDVLALKAGSVFVLGEVDPMGLNQLISARHFNG